MEHNENELLKTALTYLDYGLSIIPMQINKQPAIASWAKYQKQFPTREEVKGWFTQNPKVTGIALVTGELSGVIGLDLDLKHGRTADNFEYELSKTTPKSQTGGGGNHVLYKHPGYRVLSTSGMLFGIGVDIKGDGGLLILAPSQHESGHNYEWLVPFSRESLAPIPQWFDEKLKSYQSKAKKKDWPTINKTVVSEGERHSTLTKIIGKILHDLSSELWEEIGWPKVLEWSNSHTQPPTDEAEVRRIWVSLCKKELAKREEKPSKQNGAAQILELIEEDTNVILFHDQQGEPYIKLRIEDHFEIWSCKSKKLENLIAMKFWNRNNHALGSDAIKNALNILCAKACFEGKEYILHNRVAWLEGELWYDLTNEKGDAVKISKDGWQVVSNPPILFQRHSHQKAQVIPSAAGDASSLLKFVNIKDENQRLLLLVVMVSCFIPDIPHVIPIIYGAQGSAKSTLSKLLRKLCDPSLMEVTSMPKYNDAIQTLAHHWFLFFDNISFLSEEISDLLCKATTGSGFTKRELYTNDDDVIYSFKRVIGMNGINLVATRPDLLERSVLLQLERIPEEDRRQESEVIDEFNEALPEILSGIFNTLAKAIALHPTITLEKTPRMADFAFWGCAIAEALGYGKEAFLEAYRANITTQNEEVMSQDPVATALSILLETNPEWGGTTSQLLNKLGVIASNMGINTERDPTWPKAPNHLSRRLKTLEVILEGNGIKCFKTSEGNGRTWRIEKITRNISVKDTDVDEIPTDDGF